MVSWRATRQEHIEYQQRIDGLDETIIAWFGGWLSADGSIKQHVDGRPAVRFTLTDRDPLERFAELFGNSVGGPRPPSGLGVRDRYEWGISGWRASIILHRVRPWLSERYAERAAVFDDWVPRGHAGRKLTPEDVAAIKTALAEGGHGTGRRLAREYGVSEGMICHIRKGRQWADVGGAGDVNPHGRAG